ncbi:helix-turn-helix domain-containing protein [Spirillospora sp. NPDC048911]|uniref:helix-turn-helix domain-containing protein n=1 Tax=Spirillospora sp. NPDC048911 TaxID=3364527 RepID=UPI00371F3C5F
MGNWTAVAKVVNDRMRELNITQRELAERSGVSPATLRQIQQGVARQRSRSTLAAISRALGLPEDRLREVSLDGRYSETPDDVEASSLGQLREELAELRGRVEALESHLPERKKVP